VFRVVTGENGITGQGKGKALTDLPGKPEADGGAVLVIVIIRYLITPERINVPAPSQLNDSF
jgi:hypothetical protein